MHRAVKRRAGRFVVDRLERRQLLAAALVKDILPGTTGSTLQGSNEPVNASLILGDALLFTANGGNGYELWRTDGTAAGTALVKDISTTATAGSTSAPSSSPANFVATGDGRAFFTATTTEAGRELWVTDGTAGGTRLFADLNTAVSPTATASSNARPLAMVGGRLYFTASGDLGSGLYRTDAAGTGVEFVGAITRTSTAAGSVAVYGNRLYLSGSTPEAGTELFRTTADGSGIELVKDIYGGINGSSPASLTPFDGKLFFSASTLNEGAELWSTDGTTTAIVQDLELGGKGGIPRSLTVLGNRLYFTATTAATGAELYALTAGSSTISLVADLSTITGGSSPAQLTPLNGSLVFVASTSQYGGELYRYDPATDAVTLVGDVAPGVSGSSPQVGAVIGTRLLFTATDAVAGRELFQTDGTPEGTFRLRDINPGSASGSPAALGVLGGTFLFTASEPATGFELWAATAEPAPPLPVVSGDTLTITGTDGDDTLHVRTDVATGQLIAAVNGRTLWYTGIANVVASLGGGNDTVLVDPLSGDRVTLDAGTGTDSIQLNANLAAAAVRVDGAGVTVNGAVWLAPANAESLRISASSFDDSFTVGATPASLTLTLDGASGNDSFDTRGAGRGATLLGGAGNDTFLTGNGAVDSVDGGAGTDTATVDANDALTAVETVIVPAATGAIRGVVFNDLDADGVRDADEPGLSGWTVSITAGPNGARTATTDASGAYAFTALSDGEHFVTVPLPSGWQHAGATTNQVIINGGNGFSAVNFGPTQAAILAGFAMDDANANNIKDSIEAAIPGATVFWDANNNAIFDAAERGDVTDANGWYQFGVPVGSGGVFRTIAPAGYRPLTGYPNGIGLGFTSLQFRRQDFGFTFRPLVSGQVFIDSDRDGVHDADETFGVGATVWADLDNDGLFDAGEPTSALDSFGRYSISTIPNGGTYAIRATLPATNYAFTTPSVLTRTFADGQISAGNDFGVANTAPPSLSGVGRTNSVGEGAATTFTLGTLSDDYRDGPWAVRFDFGDGTAAQTFSVPASANTGNPVPLGSASHVYADSGSYTATLTVTDRFGVTSQRPYALFVSNVDPTLTLTPEATLYRPGSIVRAKAVATDPSAADAASLSFDWRAVRADGLIAGQGTGPDVAFFAAEAGTYTITVYVSDKDGGGARTTATVVVGNLPPTLSLSPAAGPFNEGGTVAATGVASDPDGDALAYAWTATYEDVLVASGDGAAVSFAAADDGVYVIRMTATDPYGAAAEATANVTVGSLAPTVTLTPSATSVNEGQTVTVTANVADVPADVAAGFGLTWAVTRNGTILANQVGGASFTYTPTAAGTYVVSLTAVDKDGTAGVGTTSVVAVNVAPTVAIAPPAGPFVEGQTLNFAANVSDAAGDVATMKYAWTAERDGTVVATGAAATFPFLADRDGAYVVRVTATDDDGATGTASYAFNVANVAPAATITGTSANPTEGQPVTLFGLATDPGADDRLFNMTWTVTRNGTTVFNASTSAAQWNATWTVGDSGTYVATLRAVDSDGASSTATRTFTVANLAPAVSISGPTSAKRNKPASFTFSAYDVAPDTAAGLTYQIDWDGDGRIDQTVRGGGSVTLSNKYASSGRYTLTVFVTDKDGAVGKQTLVVNVS